MPAAATWMSLVVLSTPSGPWKLLQGRGEFKLKKQKRKQNKNSPAEGGGRRMGCVDGSEEGGIYLFIAGEGKRRNVGNKMNVKHKRNIKYYSANTNKVNYLQLFVYLISK